MAKKEERKVFLLKRSFKIISLGLTAALSLSLCSFTSSAESASDGGVSQIRSIEMPSAPSAQAFDRYELSVSKVYNKSVSAYSSVSVRYDGEKVAADARMINGTPYIAVRSFFDEIGGMTVTYNSSSKVLNVKGVGFEMDIIDGSNVIYANGRTLFSMTPSAVMSNGRMYAPASSVAKAIGLSYSYDGGIVSLRGNINPITHGSVYYREDAVYWLSRIISAESRGESLLGQIAVGSVVMNRVDSELYPSTIWGVIFDKKYGVQFSPILDGSIYSAPVASAVVAAKICLEGFNVNKEALFFLYPRASTSSWIPNNREYLFSIGKHDFYA